MNRAKSFGYKLASRVRSFINFTRNDAEIAIMAMAATYSDKTSLTFYRVAISSLDEALTPDPRAKFTDG